MVREYRTRPLYHERKRLWRSCERASDMDLYTRRRTLTERIRSSASATARPVYATRSGPRSCTTRRTCPVPLTARTSTRQNAWPAASAWKSARSEPQSSVRSSATRMAARCTYPLTLLPDETRWTADNWNIHYREDAKINCYDDRHFALQDSVPGAHCGSGLREDGKARAVRGCAEADPQDNPFPAVCGAICNRRCEDACTRGNGRQLRLRSMKSKSSSHSRNSILPSGKRFCPICEKDEGGFWDDNYKMASHRFRSCRYVLCILSEHEGISGHNF
jgi:hypothetical protein